MFGFLGSTIGKGIGGIGDAFEGLQQKRLKRMDEMRANRPEPLPYPVIPTTDDDDDPGYELGAALGNLAGRGISSHRRKRDRRTVDSPLPKIRDYTPPIQMDAMDPIGPDAIYS